MTRFVSIVVCLSLTLLPVAVGAEPTSSEPPPEQLGGTVAPDEPSNGCCGACARRGGGKGGAGGGQGCGRGYRGGRDADQAQGGCPGCGGHTHREDVHALLGAHDQIERQVQRTEDGIVATTTSADPEIAARIQQHVGDMKQRLEQGAPVRMWDPLFAELFRHHDSIRMEVELIPGGVRVRESSDDPEVRKLIWQHAATIGEFISQGFDRAHRPSELPDGYAERSAASP